MRCYPQGCRQATEDSAPPLGVDLRAQRGDGQGGAAGHRARGAPAGAPRAAAGPGTQAGQLPRMGDIPGKDILYDTVIRVWLWHPDYNVINRCVGLCLSSTMTRS